MFKSQEAIKYLVWLVLTVLVITFWTASAMAVEILPQAQTSLSVEHHKSRLIRLERPASSVFIANPEIADVQVKSPSLVYLFGKQVGTTTLYAVDGQDRVIANMDIDVTHNIKNLTKAVMKVAPESNISFASVNGALVIEGVIDSPRKAEEVRQIAERFSPQEKGVINRLRIEGLNQVNLRVRIAEVSKDVDKRLGFNWNISGSLSSVAFGLGFANQLAQGIGTLTASASDFSTVLDAMEDEGLVTILSEPNLTAMSGEEASFLAGGEFPILYPGADGNTLIEFREYGVRLTFKPVILDNGRINLQVAPEVSSLSEANAVTLNSFVVPSLVTRKTKTTVELASGQSFAVAGLLQNETGHNISKFPGLGDLPVIGALFRSDSFQREETELVIIITPYLVKPISHAQAALPTDGYIPPHDVERLFVGGIYHQSEGAKHGLMVDGKGRRLIGPSGFELN